MSIEYTKKDNEERAHWYDQNNNQYIGVTSLIKTWFEQFDKQGMALKCSQNPKKKDYFDKKPEEIIQIWDKKAQKSIKKGNILHEFAENLLKSNCQDIPECQYDEESKQAFQKCLELMNEYELIGAEKVVFSPKYQIVCVIDILMKHKKNGHILIADWKTNEKIDKKSFYNFKTKEYKCGIGDLNYVQDCNYQHYGLQLNLEEFILDSEGYFPPNTQYKKQLFHIKKDKVETLTIRDKGKAIEIITESRLADIEYLKITNDEEF